MKRVLTQFTREFLTLLFYFRYHCLIFHDDSSQLARHGQIVQHIVEIVAHFVDSCFDLILDNDDGEGDGKIMAEAYAVVYHDRQPSDTLQSICFQYNVTPDKIRRANNFRGNDLVYAPDRLVIPITTPKSTPETELSNDEKVESLQSQLSKLSLSRDDALSFLELNDWNLSRTIRNVNVQKRYFSNKRE